MQHNVAYGTGGASAFDVPMHNNYYIFDFGPMPIRVEPPIKDTPNKEHLSIKTKSTRPSSYYISTY